MRTFILSAAAATLLTGPALAQDRHAGHHPAPAADASPTHEMCKSVMGRQMDGKPGHDHGRDKTGAATWPNGKPLTPAEMKKMHEVCAEKMKKADEAPKAK